MGVLFDNAAQNNTGSSPSTVTFSFTVGSNSDRVLLVSVSNNSTTASQIASVTYGGQSMTSIRRDVGTVGNGVGTIETFRLINPPTGANNVVITQGATKSTFVGTVVGSYYNVDQTTPVDVTDYTESLTATFTLQATTTVDNTWGVCLAFSQRSLSVNTNVTVRTGNNTGIFLGDTNSDQTPAGSKSMVLNVSSTPYTTWGHGIFLKPASSGTAYTQDLEEVVTVTETVRRATTKRLSESRAITDTVRKATSKRQSETITVTDSVARLLVKLKSIADSVTIADATIRKAITRELNEVATITDSVRKNSARRLSETVTITASAIAATATYMKTLLETITVTDTVSRITGYARSFVENITVTEYFRIRLNGVNALWRELYSDTADAWDDLYTNPGGTWHDKYQDN